MKKIYLFLSVAIATFSVFALTSCKKSEATVEETPAISEEELAIADAKLPEPVAANGVSTLGHGELEINLEDFELNLDDFKAANSAVKAEAHKKYLNDEMTFLPVPKPVQQSSETAVVVSRKCKLYPVASVSTDEEAKKLKDGIPIPIGTVLNISDNKICAEGKEEHYNGLFYFEDNYNWFYKTDYKGQKGIVFGADLLFKDEDTNYIIGLLYKEQGHFDKFYPICGYTPVSHKIQAELNSNRIALQEVSKDEYWLNTDCPDDMLSLYMNHLNDTPFGWDYSSMGSNLTPVFITTDLFAHSQHLIFDAMLQHVEETVFIDKLISICDTYLAKLNEMSVSVADAAENSTDISPSETIEKAILYFQTARALLELAPPIKEKTNSYRDDEEEEPKVDAAAVLAKYPESVRKDIALMDAAAGFGDSSVFEFSDGVKYTEDYSQYKPRGHYTKNERLKAYFRTMMWFGRINFCLADPDSLKATEGKPLDERQILALRMTPVALLINDITSKDEALFNTWRDLFEPVTSLIGKSDDLSFFDVLPLWKEENVTDVLSWITSTDNIIKFAEKAREKLEPPAIAGNSWVNANQFEGSEADPQNIKPAMGWRLFGQRFTYDSWIHHNLSAPRLFTRDIVSGLDVMKAFGSHTADLYLRDEYEEHGELKPKLEKLEEFFKSKDEKFWGNNYYNMVLFETGAQARFEPGSGFYFTETPKWAVKSMLAAHGTWAELRHDTILYVKQAGAAERGGDGDIEPTYRSEKLPQTVHYIEPNIPFFQGYKFANSLLAQTYEHYGLLDNKAKQALNALNKIADKALSIAQLELDDQPVPDEQLAWIATIPPELAEYVMLYEGRMSYAESDDQFKMAVIADVFTGAGAVLETGVGIPYRIYVALNDGQGGKRIAVGYTFSYYEFENPMGDRLTDEDWKATVYSGEPLNQFKPFWSKNQTLSASGFAK